MTTIGFLLGAVLTAGIPADAPPHIVMVCKERRLVEFTQSETQGDLHAHAVYACIKRVPVCVAGKDYRGTIRCRFKHA